MRYLILAFVMALGLSSASAQEGGARAVVQEQLDAFQIDDFEKAFTFASPMIKRLFGTPRNFERMVTNGYPMVHRPRSVEFQEQKRANGRVLQYVLLEDQSGRFFIAEYAMIETPDGWKIDGVQILDAPIVGA